MLMKDLGVSFPSVRVAVFPVIMLVRLPVASRAFKLLIRRLSDFSLSMEKANAMERARGRPSGTQTMTRATQVWRLLRKAETASSEMIL